MKVLHVPYCYPPDSIGGTEIFVRGLVSELRSLGVESAVAAPWDRDAEYAEEGAPVFRFRHVPATLETLYGEGDEASAAVFASVLDRTKPDVVHFHAFTSAVSLRTFRAARSRRIATVFTYHTPTVTCQRGTLMRWGRKVCDGRLTPRRCAACALHARGLVRPAAAALSLLPAPLCAAFADRLPAGRAATAIRMGGLVARRQSAARAMLLEADAVVAVCEWVRRLLLANGVPEKKLVFSRQGLTGVPVPPRGPRAPGPLRVAFFGRFERSKGVDVLVKAFGSAPRLDARLDVYGVAQGVLGEVFRRELQSLAARDARVAFPEPLPSSAVAPALAGYDLLAVPSQWLETGPLTVLEAFAAGVPVAGSRLGGVSELVRHDVDGRLVSPAHSPAAWAKELEFLSSEPTRLEALRAGVRPPKRMSETAAEMVAVYASATGGRS